MRGHTFTMPADFKLSSVLPHEILVEFDADKASYVTSRTWLMPNGAVRVSLQLPALGTVGPYPGSENKLQVALLYRPGLEIPSYGG